MKNCWTPFVVTCVYIRAPKSWTGSLIWRDMPPHFDVSMERLLICRPVMLVQDERAVRTVAEATQGHFSAKWSAPRALYGALKTSPSMLPLILCVPWKRPAEHILAYSFDGYIHNYAASAAHLGLLTFCEHRACVFAVSVLHSKLQRQVNKHPRHLKWILARSAYTGPIWSGLILLLTGVWDRTSGQTATTHQLESVSNPFALNNCPAVPQKLVWNNRRWLKWTNGQWSLPAFGRFCPGW